MLERKIITALIVSDQFCNKIKNIWDVSLLEAPTAKLLASWCWEFFLKYNKAPGKEIETIYYTKLKETKIGAELAKEIEEDILPSLSEEYTKEGFLLEPLLDETEKYFTDRHLEIFRQSVEALTKQGKREEAEKLIHNFRPLSKLGRIAPYIETAIVLSKKHMPQPTTILYPWLKEGQITMLYGDPGVGKSLLSILIGYLCGLADYDDKKCEIGQWYVKNPTGCLYVDGELGCREMVNRVEQYNWLGTQHKDRKMQIFSIPDYQSKTEDLFYLGQRKNQLELITWLKEHSTYKLIILDSATTLFGLENENDNSEWSNKVNPLLRDLRAMNVATLLLHHSGKDGKKGYRGASSMGAMLQNNYKLVSHPQWNIDAGEAWFTIKKDKQRSSGKQFNTFSIHFEQNENKTETFWEITDNY
jgi:hypothetical protein